MQIIIEYFLFQLFLVFGTYVFFANLYCRGPYLRRLTDTSVVVCWRTNQATDSQSLFFDSILGGQSNYVDGIGQPRLTIKSVTSLTPIQNIITE